jgi:hypothetical protein
MCHYPQSRFVECHCDDCHRAHCYFAVVPLNAVNRTVVRLSVVALIVPMKSSLFPGNTKGGSITVPLTSCLTGLKSAV